MKNIHVLPTDKPTTLFKDDFGNLIYSINMDQEQNHFEPQHLFITNDEEIKEGDWFIFYSKSLGWPPKLYKHLGLDVHNFIKVYEDMSVDFTDCKKIILTTDPDLIKDGVQAIDDKFLEWFINNPSCEWVEVNHFGMCCSNQLIAQCINCNQYNPVYKIIIPKEPKQEWTPTQGEQVWIKVFSNWSSGTYIGYDTTKHIHLVRENEEGGGNLLSSSKILPYKSMPNEPKQETLEEAAERFYPMSKGGSIWNPSEDDCIKANKQEGFIEGTKWQAERMYSEEEVLNILQEFKRYLSFGDEISQAEWFEQFKRK